jgi:CRISPR system Cascade subunit CasE
MSAQLHLIRLVLDRRELARIARRHHLGRNADEGYLLHAGLAQLFATSSDPARVPLLTFAVDDTLSQARSRPDLTFLLGYSELDRSALVGRMGQAGQSLVRSCESREVPSLREGTRAGFRVRICPIVRTRRPVTPSAPAAGRARIREVDAWVRSPEASAGKSGGVVESVLPFEHSARVWAGREAAYARWVAGEFGRNEAAILAGPARMTAFKRDRLYRRGAESGHVLERPNAVMEGILRVQVPEAFRALLGRGVGRHRAFGFGMLLLRPVGS